MLRDPKKTKVLGFTLKPLTFQEDIVVEALEMVKSDGRVARRLATREYAKRDFM